DLTDTESSSLNEILRLSDKKDVNLNNDELDLSTDLQNNLDIKSQSSFGSELDSVFI
ncbi:MAG: hypothetical protein MHPSP_004611, partial [Paramarteilia canceri]